MSNGRGGANLDRGALERHRPLHDQGLQRPVHPLRRELTVHESRVSCPLFVGPAGSSHRSRDIPTGNCVSGSYGCSVFLTAQWLAANGDPAWDRLRALVEDIRNALSKDLLRAKTTELGELCLLQLAEIHRSFVLHNTLADDSWERSDAWLRHPRCIQIPDPDP